MRKIDIVKRAGRSLLYAKARTLLTALAIAVGAFALTLTLAASNGAQNYADTIIRNNFDPSELIVTAAGDVFSSTDTSKPQEYNQNFSAITLGSGAVSQVELLNDQDLQTIKSTKGVAAVRTQTTVPLQYITRDGTRKYIAVGQPFSSYRQPKTEAGSLANGLAKNRIALPAAYLQSLGFNNAQSAIGKTVRISVQKQANQQNLIESFIQNGSASAATLTDVQSKEQQFIIQAVLPKPSTLVQPGTELYLTLNQSDAMSLQDYITAGTTNYHKYAAVYAKVTNGINQTNLNAIQTSLKKQGFGAQSVADTQKTITQIITVLQGIVSVFGLIAVVASVFGIVNTMYISVLQRTREIGLMKALGMRQRNINQLFLFEAGLLGLLGGLLGVVTAVVLGTLLNPFISDKLSLGDTSLLAFSPLQLILLVLVLTVVGVGAGLLPARKAARLDPIEALRTE